jgi:DNA polymerase III delta prime subunit
MAKMNIPSHLEKITTNLCEAAHKGSLNQSVLLTGQEGIGQFSLVMELATTLLCETDKTACGVCSSCREVGHLVHPDFLLLFPFPNLKPESKKLTVFSFSDPVSSSARFSEDTKDAIEEYKQSLMTDPFALPNFEKKENIPVEVVKDLIHALAKRPMRGGRRVVAILDIDKMAYGAADLFLKTVEEPPHNTHLILTTSRPDLLYPTLLSRTQRIKIPPVPEEQTEMILRDKLQIDGNLAKFLARISGGSPGMGVRYFESDIIARRERLLKLFTDLLNKVDTGQLVIDINAQYSGGRGRFDDMKIDFDIIETIIHDLYLLGENRLENHLINVDIAKLLQSVKPPSREALDIWRSCLTETRRACTVNNVAADTGMIFFFISCAEASENLARPKYTLP